MKNVIIVGAGVAGKELLALFNKHKNLGIKVKGFIDDDKNKINKNISGYKVLGNINHLSKIINDFKIDEIFIAVPSAKGSFIKEVIEKCRNLKISFKVIPRTLDVIKGRVSINEVRRVEVSDLIGREIVKLEQKHLESFFKGKKILITGACGSIGSEICRQLALFSPGKLIFYDWWENGMFELGTEFKSKYNKTLIEQVIGDIKDNKRLEKIFSKEKIDIVFHAAAYKHVPLMEENPSEAVMNNVLGTKNMVEVVNKYKVTHFVFISTDKAVYPKNIMGATKLIGEGIVSDYSKRSSTKFISVRFGNVLDSFGSVLPLFKKQIKEGGPVTVTHKNVERFFMSIPEAVQLILQATTIGSGGEIFVLDMGEPVRIYDLAKILIKLSGFTPGKEIKISLIGLRRGEKLKENLFTKNEELVKTKNERIFTTKNFGLKIKDFESYLKDLIYYASISDNTQVRIKLRRIIKNNDKFF